jgi:hypothetical protein
MHSFYMPRAVPVPARILHVGEGEGQVVRREPVRVGRLAFAVERLPVQRDVVHRRVEVHVINCQ